MLRMLNKHGVLSKLNHYSAWIVTVWKTENRGKIGVGRATASIFGAFLLSLAINVAMSMFLPLETNNRLSLSMVLTIPIWVGLAFYCLLLRNALVAWVMTVGVSLLLFAIILLWGF